MSKPWWKSKTIYALAVSLLAHVLVMLGAGEGEAGELAENFVTAAAPIVGIIAAAVGAWGRSRATGPLTAKEDRRMRSSPFAAFAAVVVALLVTACGTFGVEAPQSFNERLAYAYTTHTAVLDATTAALEGGDIDVTEAEEVAAMADNARDLLDSARSVYDAGREAEASRQLTLALSILNELQRYSREE